MSISEHVNQTKNAHESKKKQICIVTQDFYLSGIHRDTKIKKNNGILPDNRLSQSFTKQTTVL